MSVITTETEVHPKKYGRTVKCPHCEQQLNRNTEDFVEHSGRYYHQPCFNERFADSRPRNELYEYICKLQNVSFPNTFVLRQIKEFQEPPFNYTLRGMLTTLKFAHETLGVPVKRDVGIGIIEFYYRKAIDYHINLYNIRKSSTENNYDNTEVVIYTTPPKINKKKLIDIGGL